MVYGSAGIDTTLWLCVDGNVMFPWIKFKLPVDCQVGYYRITDAILCHGMGKMVAASDKGRLLIYPATVEKEDKGEMGQEVRPIIVKVAHEVSCNFFGDLIASYFTYVRTPRLQGQNRVQKVGKTLSYYNNNFAKRL